MMKERNDTNAMNETSGLRRPGSFHWAAKKATVGALALLLGSGLTALAQEGNDNRAPDVPQEIAVLGNNKVQFHALGVGVQIYTWDGSSWTGPVPEATLFHGDAVVAIHFAGPSWQSNSGSTVVGAAVAKVTVDQTAIPWVKLQAASTVGPGIFADVSFIQRVNTVGGLPPKTDGTFVGQVARSPYTADYFFYRDTTH